MLYECTNSNRYIILIATVELNQPDFFQEGLASQPRTVGGVVTLSTAGTDQGNHAMLLSAPLSSEPTFSLRAANGTVSRSDCRNP
jgi:hypothetical protein